MAKRTRKPKETNESTDVISTTVGMIGAGQTVQPAYSRAAGVRQYASWVYAAARINAVGISSVPLRLYTMGGSEGEKRYGERLYRTRAIPGERRKYLTGLRDRTPHRNVVSKMIELGEDFEEVVSHPAMDLLSSVNPWQTGYELLTKLALHLQLCGDAFWYVERGGIGGVPSMLLPLMPKLVEIVPSKVRFIDGYLYGMRQAEPVALTTEEVVHFRFPNPDDQFYGKGWAEAAWSVINQNNAAHAMDTAFFANFARPDYLVVIENEAGDGKDAIKRFQEQIKAQNQGVKKTGRALSVTGKVDLKPMNFMPKDLSGRDEIVEEIAAIAGVPVTMLKANDPNLASAEVGYASWREMTIAPSCKLIEDVLNQLYLPMWGLEGQAVFAFDDPVPKNRERDSVILDREFRSGLKTLNEARETIGDEPSDDPYADRPLFNGQPLGGFSATLGGPLGGNGGVAESADQPADGGDVAKPTTPGQVTPTAKPVDAASVAVDPGAAVQDTALNGAQVTSLVDLVSQARAGTIPVDTAEAIAGAAFPLMTTQQLVAIFGPIRTAKPLPTPEPTPQPEPPVSSSKRKGEALDGDTTPPIRLKLNTDTAKAFRQSDFTGCDHAHHKAADLPLDDIAEQRVRAFVASVDAVLRDQAAALAASMQVQGVSADEIIRAVTAVLRDPEWVSLMREAAAPHIGNVLQNGAIAGLEKLPRIEGVPPPSFEFTNPEVSRWVDRATTRLAVGVNQTTEVNVRSILGDGLEKGETIAELSKRVTEATGVGGQRAEAIARTESARAYEAGQREAWKQAGVTHHRWLLAPDACEFCRTLSRSSQDQAMPLGHNFAAKGTTVQGVSGGVLSIDYEDVQGPPLHPNCRCTTIPVEAP